MADVIIRPKMRNVREYYRPKTLDDALRLLAREDLHAVALAGGTQLMAESSPEVEVVVDLEDLPLAFIAADDSGLRLGALTRLAELAESPLVRVFADGVLADAARLAATSLLRNQGTLAGTLLSRIANGELPPVLLALDAEVLVHRIGSSTTLPLATLYAGLEQHTRSAILAEVRVPAAPPGSRISRHRVARTPNDQAILTVTALTCVTRGVITESRVAIAGVGPRPMRLSNIETALLGVKAEAGVIQATVIAGTGSLDMPDDLLASAEYRRAVLPVLIRRAVMESRLEDLVS